MRFADTATRFFSHRLRSEALIIRAFDVTFGTTYVPGVAGSEVLSALVAAVRIKPRRILPPRLQPPTRLPSQFRQSLTQDRFWQRMQDFIQPGDVIPADVGTSSAGTAGLRMPSLWNGELEREPRYLPARQDCGVVHPTLHDAA